MLAAACILIPKLLRESGPGNLYTLNLENSHLKMESERHNHVSNRTTLSVATGFRRNRNKPLMKQVPIAKNEIQLLNLL